jgi:hypothetical protein
MVIWTREKNGSTWREIEIHFPQTVLNVIGSPSNFVARIRPFETFCEAGNCPDDSGKAANMRSREM